MSAFPCFITVRVNVPERLMNQLFLLILEQGSIPAGRNRVDLIRAFRAGMQEEFPSYSCGLKEAKEFVDEICRRLENFTAPYSSV